VVEDPEPAMESVAILCTKTATVGEGEEATVKSGGAVQWWR